MIGNVGTLLTKLSLSGSGATIPESTQLISNQPNLNQLSSLSGPETAESTKKIPATMPNSDPLYLQCSCRCKDNVFTLGPVNCDPASGSAECVNDKPLSFIRCHCRNCRSHASSAFACYLTKGGMPFCKKEDLVFSKSNLREIPFRCRSLGQFRSFLEQQGGSLPTAVKKDTAKKEDGVESSAEGCGSIKMERVSKPDSPGSPTSESETKVEGDGAADGEAGKTLKGGSSPSSGSKSSSPLGSKENPKSPIKTSTVAGQSEAALQTLGKKVICDKCYSVLYMDFNSEDSQKEVEAATGLDFVVIAAGCIDDGDYRNDKKGRKGDQSLWPDEKFPKVLNSVEWREMIKEERAPW